MPVNEGLTDVINILFSLFLTKPVKIIFVVFANICNKIEQYSKVFRKIPDIKITSLERVCIMEFENLKNENIIIEIRALIDESDDLDDIDGYCQFMREMILNTSGLN